MELEEIGKLQESLDKEATSKVSAHILEADPWSRLQPKEIRAIKKMCVHFNALLEAQFGFIDRENSVHKLLIEITDHLVVSSDIKITDNFSPKIHLLNDFGEPDAFTLPNGDIYINITLLKLCETEDQIAAVIAHELIHGNSSHSIETILRNNDKDLLHRIIEERGFTRIAELEADILGASIILAKSDYNPNAMVTLFEKFQADVKKDHYLDSHGSFRDRIFQQKLLSKNLDLSGTDKPEIILTTEVNTKIKKLEFAAKNFHIPIYLPNGGTNIQSSFFSKLLDTLRNNPEIKEIVATTVLLKKWYLETFQLHKNEALKDKDPRCLIGYNQASNKDLLSFKLANQRALLLDALLSHFQELETPEKRCSAVIFLTHMCGIDFFEKIFDSPSNKNISSYKKNDFNIAKEGELSFGFTKDNLLIVNFLNDIDTLGLTPLLEAYKNPIWQNDRFKNLISENDLSQINNLFAELIEYEMEFLLNDEGDLDVVKIVNSYSQISSAYNSFSGANEQVEISLQLGQILADYPKLHEKLLGLKGAVGVLKEGQDKIETLLNEGKKTSDEAQKQILEQLNELLPLLENSHELSQYLNEALKDQNNYISFFSIFSNITDLDVENIANERIPYLLSVTIDYLDATSDSSYGFGNVFSLLKIEDSIVFDKGLDQLFRFLERSYVTEGLYPKVHFKIYEYLESLCRKNDFSTAFKVLLKVNHSGFDLSTAAILSTQSIYNVAVDEKLSEYVYFGLELAERLIDSASTPLEKLLATQLFFDRNRKFQTQSWICEEISNSSSREEIISFISSNPKLVSISSLPLINQLVKLSQTKSELKESTNIVWQIFRHNAFSEGVKLQFVEQLANDTSKSVDALLAGLASYKSETPLFEIFAEKWYNTYRFPLGLYTELDLFSLLNNINRQMSEKDFTRWKHFWDEDAYKIIEFIRDETTSPENRAKQVGNLAQELSLTNSLNRVYELTPEAKKIIVYKLLSSNRGALRNSSSREKLFGFFIDEHLELADNEKEEIKNITETLFSTAKITDVLPYLLGIISERAFKQPPREEDPIFLVESLRFIKPNLRAWSDVNLNTDRKVVARLPASHRKNYDKNRIHEILEDPVKEKLARILLPERFKEKTILDTKEIEQRMMSKLGVRQFEDKISSEKINKYQALRLLINQDGVLVRGTQLLLQVWQFDSPEVYKELSSVFDNATGTSKSAFSKVVYDLIGDAIEDDDQLLDEIGAGSKNTVYKLRKASGDEFAIKVLNPNAESNTKVTLNILKETVSKMAEKDPSNHLLGIIEQSVIPLLEEWELGDINDLEFFNLDPKFSDWLAKEEDSRKGRFRIVAPKIIHNIYLGNNEAEARKKVKLEEFVEGTNINNLRIGKESDFSKGIVSLTDYQEIVQTLESNYLNQIKNGLIHSNPHPGNFILTKDGQLAIIDRNFYLQLTTEDKAVFKEIYIKSFLPYSNPIVPFLRHIAPKLSEEAIYEKAEIIKKRVGKLSFNDASQARKLIFELTQENIRVPLRFMLIAIGLQTFKNLKEGEHIN